VGKRKERMYSQFFRNHSAVSVFFEKQPFCHYEPPHAAKHYSPFGLCSDRYGL
jgi:hypothetical protein